MAGITTPHIAKFQQGLTYARNYKWIPGAGSPSLVGKVVVFRLKDALYIGGYRRDFILKSSDDPGALDENNNLIFENSSIVFTNAAEGEFALSLTDEMTAKFQPLKDTTKWSFYTENSDGSITPMYIGGKAQIVEING